MVAMEGIAHDIFTMDLKQSYIKINFFSSLYL